MSRRQREERDVVTILKEGKRQGTGKIQRGVCVCVCERVRVREIGRHTEAARVLAAVGRVV